MGAWPGVPFAEVRAYAWPATEGEPLNKVISDRGKLLPGVLNPKGVVLSKEQVRRLLATQRRRVETRRTVSACYDPHNLFVFLDRRGRMVAFLEICFDCRNTRARPEDERADPDLPALAAIFSELKLPFGAQASLEELRKMDRAARGHRGVWRHPRKMRSRNPKK